MKTRNKISTALQASVFSAEHAEELARELYDAVAHELAEKIRNMERRNAWPERHGACGAVLPSQVADLIDPEVSS